MNNNAREELDRVEKLRGWAIRRPHEVADAYFELINKLEKATQALDKSCWCGVYPSGQLCIACEVLLELGEDE